MEKIIEMPYVKGMESNYRPASQYRGAGRCQTARAHDLGFTTEKNEIFDNAVSKLDVIRLFFAGELEIEEISTDLMSQGIENPLEQKKAVRDLLRYLMGQSKNDKITVPETRYFVVNGERVKVSPTLVFERDNEIEVVTVRTGKPTVMQRGKKRDASVESSLEMFFNLIYARSLVKSGEKKIVKSSFHFLRKNTDKAGIASHYDSEFYGAPADGNVVTLNGGWHKGGDSLYSKSDEAYLAQLTGFLEGIPAEQCSEDDCKSCSNKAACKYQKSPERHEVKAKKKGEKFEYSPVQSAIIDCQDPYIRVIAKAGTGKTEVLTERSKRIIASGTDPKRMLHVTFTDAAAGEMRERIVAKCVAEGLDVTEQDVEVMTFHSLGFRLICRNYEELGFSKVPVVIDKDDVLKKDTVDRILREHDFYTLENQYSALDWTLKCFSLIKENELDTSGGTRELYDALAGADCGWGSFLSQADVQKMYLMYDEYDSVLKKNSWITYSDIEPMMNRILEAHPEQAEELGYRYITVDEFQDSNEAQMRAIKALTSTSCFVSLMVVGDDNQSIYGFRNTSQEMFLNFWEKLGVAGTDFRLTDNHRSTPQILTFANEYIALNKERDETIMTAVRGNGHRPNVQAFWDPKDETKFVCEVIEKAYEEGMAYEDMAIMAYKKTDLTKFAAALSEKGIPWITKYPMPLVENSRVQAAIKLGLAFYQPEAEELYFDFVVCRNDGHIFEDKTNAQIKEEVFALKDEWLSMNDFDLPYQRKLFHERLEELRGRDELYDAFLELLYEKEDIQSELEYIVKFRKFGETVARKLNQNYKGVVLTTAHSSKGLEWPLAIVSVSSFDNEYLHKKNSESNIEERRRLLYVAMTRARDSLYITGNYKAFGNKKDGYTYNQFLAELYGVAGKSFNPAQAEWEHEEKKKENKPQKVSKTQLAAAAQITHDSGMTPEQKEEYERLIKGATQISFAS